MAARWTGGEGGVNGRASGREDMIREAPESEARVVRTDLKGGVGATADGYKQVHSGSRFRVRNEEAERLKEVAECTTCTLVHLLLEERQTPHDTQEWWSSHQDCR